jgi:hypothetical protein
VRSEDLIGFGFESEFVGRLPVRAVFEHLTEEDLYQILKNPNNPIILGKKLDFAAYNIGIKFEDNLLRTLAGHAFDENTGARGLVSAVEKALLDFERKLPSAGVNTFPATMDIVKNPGAFLHTITAESQKQETIHLYNELIQQEKESIKKYLKENQKNLAQKYSLTMTPSRIEIVATCYAKNTLDIGNVINKIKSYCDEIKKIELYFFKNNDINIVLEEDAIDFIIEKLIDSPFELKDVDQKINQDFQHGLKLAREKTNRNRFFITRRALLDPEAYISEIIRDQIKPT